MPKLTGMSVWHARFVWYEAGFTGWFSPAFGHDHETVRTQSQTAGDCLPAKTTMVVTTYPSD
ncbi:MAG TPA: hypothetical protein VK656_07975 [Candidatus Acidoferrum sp.]|nr:hypothetical protein [Candidatus Acidoferrum sp.]